MIFGYPNTTQHSLDIYNYLLNNNDIKINNLIIGLEPGEYIIENNIFGYEYSGIEIVENCKDLEDIYLVDLNDIKIENNYFFKKK